MTYGNQIYGDNHVVMYSNIELLHCIYETNIKLQVKYTSIAKEKEQLKYNPQVSPQKSLYNPGHSGDVIMQSQNGRTGSSASLTKGKLRFKEMK